MDPAESAGSAVEVPSSPGRRASAAPVPKERANCQLHPRASAGEAAYKNQYFLRLLSTLNQAHLDRESFLGNGNPA
ncbi:Hypothetical protein NTJ_10522 [Nesidiocoris tenuis]|uniref:Uncharacterized protein n=1 Tax=Nesidiocoris tenuis TaxID=355587 RepID=A0ABN7AZW0_9HEMI|nr:Hypothetical protein NTJ_10522 [Nesidiocoris tenuis]